MEEREVTEVRSELPLEGHVRQRQSDDAPTSPAARHADPAAKGHIASPAVVKDAKRIGELGFESQQRGKVGIIAQPQRRGGSGSDRRRQ